MIHLIAAVDKNQGIGINGHLLCHISEDLKRFKALTSGHTIIMGRKTFESLPGILPQRHHIIVTRQKQYKRNDSHITVYHSVEDVVAALLPNKDYFVIGGASMYESFMPFTYSQYITEIDAVFTADTFFPKFLRKDWYIAELQEFAADEHNKYAYRFARYVRREMYNLNEMTSNL